MPDKRYRLRSRSSFKSTIAPGDGSATDWAVLKPFFNCGGPSRTRTGTISPQTIAVVGESDPVEPTFREEPMLALTEQSRVLAYRRLLGSPVAKLDLVGLGAVEAGIRFTMNIPPLIPQK